MLVYKIGESWSPKAVLRGVSYISVRYTGILDIQVSFPYYDDYDVSWGEERL